MNNSILAALLFIYIFAIQYLPLSYDLRLAAQLSIGIAGMLVAFFYARIPTRLSAVLVSPVIASFLILTVTRLDHDYLYFAAYGLLVVTILAITWRMRR